VALLDLGPLGHGPDHAWLALVEAAFSVGPSQGYVVPVVVRAEALPDGHAIGRLESAGPPRLVYDAFDDPEACLRLLAVFKRDEALATERGRIRFTRTVAFPMVVSPAVRSARRLTSEQSNTCVAYDEALILKTFRRLSWGVNPDCEVTGFLTARTRFSQIARLAGSIEYTGPGGLGATTTLAMLQRYVPNQGEGWTFTLDHLRRLCDLVRSRSEPDFSRGAALVREFSAEHHLARRRLGELTGALHVALASTDTDPAFAPELITEGDVARWVAAIAEQARHALATLRACGPGLAPPDRQAAETLLTRGAAVEGRVIALETLVQASCVKIRIHGDYHLGQTLRTEDDFVLFDFEGEPARSLAERRAKHCPLKDVAGMLRSLDYVVASVCRAAAGDDAAEEARLNAWGEIWRRAAVDAFLDGYRVEVARSPSRLLPASPAAVGEVLTVYELDKAFYELAYELDNRPAWVRIPLHGLLRLLP
jgi:maltose alpha-D-glucosyltransferase/alpha-amylase